MLLLLIVFALLSGLFYYCQATANGLGRKRWALAGSCFGPFIWPMFCMKKRMKVYQLLGFGELVLVA